MFLFVSLTNVFDITIDQSHSFPLIRGKVWDQSVVIVIVRPWIVHIFSVLSSKILHYSQRANCVLFVVDVKDCHSIINGKKYLNFEYR